MLNWFNDSLIPLNFWIMMNDMMTTMNVWVSLMRLDLLSLDDKGWAFFWYFLKLVWSLVEELLDDHCCWRRTWRLTTSSAWSTMLRVAEGGMNTELVLLLTFWNWSWRVSNKEDVDQELMLEHILWEYLMDWMSSDLLELQVAPSLTSSSIQRYLSSMCFERREMPNLEAIDF